MKEKFKVGDLSFTVSDNPAEVVGGLDQFRQRLKEVARSLDPQMQTKFIKMAVNGEAISRRQDNLLAVYLMQLAQLAHNELVLEIMAEEKDGEGQETNGK